MSKYMIQESDEQRMQRMVSTYRSLRIGLGVMSFLFPLILYYGGLWFYNISIQDSLSAYYFADENGLNGEGPMRTWFVGLLFALGIALFIYKGFPQYENILLNVAGFFAVAVAVFPMGIDCNSGCSFTIHGASAIIAFISIGIVAVFDSGVKWGQLPTNTFEWLYILSAVGMILAPIIAYILTWPNDDRYGYTIVAEWAGLWSFSIYWWTKTIEMWNRRREVASQPAPEQKQVPVPSPSTS